MLTDAKCKNAKGAEKAYKLTDSGGLFLYVSTTGSRLWRLKYRFREKEKLLSIGAYPTVSLADARAERDKAKAELKAGRDPSAVKKIARISVASANSGTFEAIANEWFELNEAQWSKRHANDVINSLKNEIAPYLGSFMIDDLQASDVLAVLRATEQQPAHPTTKLAMRILALTAVRPGTLVSTPWSEWERMRSRMRCG